MRIKRVDHVGIVVNDLTAVKDFFLELGLELKGEWEMEGDLMGYAIGLHDVKVRCVGLGTSDSQTWIELIQFLSPSNEQEVQKHAANTLGIRHIAITVEDIETVVAKLKSRGTELFSEIRQYKDVYKLCYVRGPEGIILELAEEMK
ncbi:VOC family protein [Oceanobacillus luteolus]|uniref:VOC family protein n=1 Tax=Oceanobacillus luteolus TaxID=1274358 RepID=UPI00203C1422|nr:VOC family protein [Oceanobacillus luteolus]MCM3742160.1 VOC family protein [Oceanobacillus luteolus]